MSVALFRNVLQKCQQFYTVSVYMLHVIPSTLLYMYIGDITSVDGTEFDLRQPTTLGDVIHNIDGGGFDHNFCIQGPTGKRLAAR